MVKPKTLYTCFVLPLKEISLASSSRKLIADRLIDKSLNAMKLFLIECAKGPHVSTIRVI